jgi:hypothetical protein
MEMQMFRKEIRFIDVPESMLKWMNLGGRPSQYNPKGARSFELELPEENARDLYELGWRVKKRGYDPDKDKFVNVSDLDAPLEKETYKLKVTVNYDSNNPPKIYRVVDGQKTRRLMKPDAENADHDVAKIDNDAILSCDLIINGWKSSRDGIISAFLDTAVFVVEENSVLDKWSSFDVEDEDSAEYPWESQD